MSILDKVFRRESQTTKKDIPKDLKELLEVIEKDKSKIKDVDLLLNLFKDIESHQSCKKCGRVQRFEFVLKDHVWNRLLEGNEYKDKTLCIECFLQELELNNKVVSLNTNDVLFLGSVGLYSTKINGFIKGD